MTESPAPQPVPPSTVADAADPPSPMSLNEIFRRFRRNIAVVIGSRLVFGLLNLATNVLVIRAFGLAEMGVVLLLQSYVRLCAGLVKLESWQAVLSFGAGLLGQDETRLRRLFGFTLALDIVAMAAAILGAIVFLPWAAALFEWPAEVVDFAPIFAISVMFITHGTPNGIMRLFDRVDTLAVQFALNATLRFLGCALAAILGGDVLHVVLAWFAGSMLSGLYLWIVCIKELVARRIIPIFRVSWLKAGQEFPRIWRFLWMTNLAGYIGLILNQATTMFIGAQIGPAAAATYEVARRFSNALSRPTRLLGPLIFPEISKLAANRDWQVIRTLLLKQIRMTALLALGVAAVLFPVLPYLIPLLFGPEMAGQVWLFIVLLTGVLVGVMGFALEPTLLSANKPGTALMLKLVATVGYLVVSGLTYQSFGIVGFALGLLTFHIVFQALFMTVSLRLLRRRQAREAAAT